MRIAVAGIGRMAKKVEHVGYCYRGGVARLMKGVRRGRSVPEAPCRRV